MGRWTVAAILFVVVTHALVAPVAAQDNAADAQPARPQMKEVDPNAPAPAADPAAEDPQGFARGSGGSLAILPAVLLWLLVIGWAATTVWAARDELRPASFTAVWLPILAFPFFLVALGAWWMPLSAVACGLTAAAWLGTLVPYAVVRDKPVAKDRRVLSVQNAGFAAARRLQPLLRRMGIKLDLESRSLAGSLPDIEIAASPGDAATPPEARLAEASALEGFAGFRELVQRCIAMRAEQAVVEIGPQGATVRQLIDGVWQPLKRLARQRVGLKVVDEWEDASKLDAEETKQLLAVVRSLCGAPAKPGQRAGGGFVVTLQKRTIPCRVAFDKSETANRMRWEFQPPPPAFASLEAIGMEPADAAKVKQALTLVNSLIVVSSPSREGLTTTFAQIVLTADRLLRDFVILEDERTPFREIQNVKPFRWNGAEKLAPVTVLENAMRGYPTAIVVPHLEDAPLAAELVKRAGEMLVIVGIRADDAVGAVEKLIALGMPRADLAATLQAATCQRLLRRVCPKCAEDYAPAPDLLAKLKVPAREGLMFKKPSAGGCPACSGTGYLGRAALVEVAGGPTVSKAIGAGVDRATLLKAAQRDGMKRLTEAGVAMVAAGLTTLDEVQRILKKDKEKG